MRAPRCSFAQYRAAKRTEPAGDIRIERFGWTFCPGDKIMQVENDYDKDVYNGDVGVASRIDMEEGELSDVEMSLADWRRQTAVNLDGVFLSVKYAVPAMRRAGGGSIIITSIATALANRRTPPFVAQ
jgi:hypothetical protein